MSCPHEREEQPWGAPGRTEFTAACSRTRRPAPAASRRAIARALAGCDGRMRVREYSLHAHEPATVMRALGQLHTILGDLLCE